MPGHHFPFRKVFAAPKAVRLAVFSCAVILPLQTFDSTVELCPDRLLVTDQSSERFSIKFDEIVSIAVPSSRKVGLVLFTGTPILLRLAESDHSELLAAISARCDCPKPVPFDPPRLFKQEQGTTEKWVHCRLSNYEYLLFLNRLSGRDFQDLEHYPLFPWLQDRRALSQSFDGRSLCVKPPMDAAMAAQFQSPPFERDIAALTERCATSGVEAVPELFAIPEFTSLEHCYGLRKVLESPEVSAELHSWFSLIWSSDCKSGIAPLFSGSHPRRVSPVRPLTSLVSVSLNDCLVQAVLIVKPRSFIVRYRSATTVTDLEFRLRKPTKPPVQSPPKELGGSISKGTVFGEIDGRFVFVSGRDLWWIDGDGHISEVVLSEKPNAAISAIAAAGECLLVGSEDSSLVLYHNLQTFWRTFAYRATVVACSISIFAKVAVSALADQTVIVSSLATGRTVHVLSVTPAVAERVLVTPAWGFIVAYAVESMVNSRRHWLQVWTVNGQAVKRYPIPFAVEAWCAWRSIQGFDFIAVVGADGDVYVAEVCYIDSLECVFRAGEPVVELGYVDDLDSIVVIAREGRVWIVPFQPV
jgi:hypothetical protein